MKDFFMYLGFAILWLIGVPIGLFLVFCGLILIAFYLGVISPLALLVVLVVEGIKAARGTK
jgi:hypothetical protein